MVGTASYASERINPVHCAIASALVKTGKPFVLEQHESPVAASGRTGTFLLITGGLNVGKPSEPAGSPGSRSLKRGEEPVRKRRLGERLACRSRHRRGDVRVEHAMREEDAERHLALVGSDAVDVEIEMASTAPAPDDRSSTDNAAMKCKSHRLPR